MVRTSQREWCTRKNAFRENVDCFALFMWKEKEKEVEREIFWWFVLMSAGIIGHVTAIDG